MKILASVLLVLLGIAGASACEVPEDAAKAPTTKTPTAITVSTKSTCNQLFNGDDKGPLEVVVDWWLTDEGMTLTLSDTLEEVEQIAATAGTELKPYLLTTVSETRGVAVSGGDATTFKAAAYEVTNVCLNNL